MLPWTLSNRHVKHEPFILCAELPSAPYDIALLYCDGQSMMLNWKRPVHSGGAEVTDYYIDKCNVAKKQWHEVNVSPIKERLYKVCTNLPPPFLFMLQFHMRRAYSKFLCLQVPNLTLGSVYQFRVYGANLIGLGDTSAVSAPFTCGAWNMPEPGNKHHTCRVTIKNHFTGGKPQWKCIFSR